MRRRIEPVLPSPATEAEADILRWAEITCCRLSRVGTEDSAHIDSGALFAAALEGGVRALERFDPARGVAFRSFAISYIRGAVWEELRRQDYLPRSLRLAVKRGEIAKEDLPMRLVSLDAAFEFHDGEGLEFLLLDQIADARETAEERLLAASDRERIERLVDRLPGRWGEVVRRCYWRGETNREIARALGLSESRVFQILADARRRLAAQIDADETLRHLRLPWWEGESDGR